MDPEADDTKMGQKSRGFGNENCRMLIETRVAAFFLNIPGGEFLKRFFVVLVLARVGSDLWHCDSHQWSGKSGDSERSGSDRRTKR